MERARERERVQVRESSAERKREVFRERERESEREKSISLSLEGHDDLIRLLGRFRFRLAHKVRPLRHLREKAHAGNITTLAYRCKIRFFSADSLSTRSRWDSSDWECLSSF